VTPAPPSIFAFWLDPLGLTPARLLLALTVWTFLLAGAWALFRMALYFYLRGRRSFLLKQLRPFLANPENEQHKLPVPVWPGDHGILMDEILNIGTRERGLMSIRIQKELSRPFWIEQELLRMTSFRPSARAAASQRLGKIAEPKALPFLSRACMDPFQKVRHAAARALFSMDPKAFTLLLPRFFSLTSVWRPGEIEELFISLGREATPCLQPVLQNATEQTQARVIHLLGQLADSKALEMLMSMNQNTNPRLRSLADATLKKYGATV